MYFSTTWCCNWQDPLVKKPVTADFSKTVEWNQSPRPCYDMVEEYNRSLDEYKDKVSLCELSWLRGCSQTPFY